MNSVVALQQDLSELDRIGGKINGMEMTSEMDLEYVQKLLGRFAECGIRVSQKLHEFSSHLQEAQARAEAVTQGVSHQTESFNAIRDQQNLLIDRFQELGEKVRELNARVGQVAGAQDSGNSETLKSALPAVEQDLKLLIADLEDLGAASGASRMRKLEQNVHSLKQTLQALQTKLQHISSST